MGEEREREGEQREIDGKWSWGMNCEQRDGGYYIYLLSAGVCRI
jgi:hypothetical protein